MINWKSKEQIEEVIKTSLLELILANSAMKPIVKEDMQVSMNKLCNAERKEKISDDYVSDLYFRMHANNIKETVVNTYSEKFPDVELTRVEFKIVEEDPLVRREFLTILDNIPESYSMIKKVMGVLGSNLSDGSDLDYFRRCVKKHDEFRITYLENQPIEDAYIAELVKQTKRIAFEEGVSIIDVVINPGYAVNVQKSIFPTRNTAKAYVDIHSKYTKELADYCQFIQPLNKGCNTVADIVVKTRLNQVLNEVSEAIKDYKINEIDRIYSLGE